MIRMLTVTPSTSTDFRISSHRPFQGVGISLFSLTMYIYIYGQSPEGTTNLTGRLV